MKIYSIQEYENDKGQVLKVMTPHIESVESIT